MAIRAPVSTTPEKNQNRAQKTNIFDTRDHSVGSVVNTGRGLFKAANISAFIRKDEKVVSALKGKLIHEKTHKVKIL
jgi:hypothetical protein